MSSKYPRCPGCKGNKKIIGLGMVPRECPYCKGVGYIKSDDDEVVIDITEENPKPKKTKA